MDARTRITKARIGLIKRQPFFGVLALRLKVVERPDLNPPTLATDGKHLFYHPNWVDKATQDVVEAGVAHEVGHCALNHMARRNGRQPRRWNYAIDYAVNAMLEDCGFKIPEGWVHDPVFKGLSAEKIYTLLPDDPDDEGNGTTFDGHDDAKEPLVAPVEWELATIQAAESAMARDPTSVPGTIKRFIDELHAPKVDWRSVLRRFATQACKSDYSWARPNRMFLSIGLIMPGLHGEAVKEIVPIIDTSGSISKEILTAFGSEIADIRETVKPESVRLMYCDADVNHVEEFLPDDNFEVRPYGGGGTDFRPPFKYIEDHDIEPSCVVYLTDGYGPFPKEPPPYPVLWVMTTNVQPPWGECVRIEL